LPDSLGYKQQRGLGWRIAPPGIGPGCCFSIKAPAVYQQGLNRGRSTVQFSTYYGNGRVRQAMVRNFARWCGL
jgi:hypothetical protein